MRSECFCDWSSAPYSILRFVWISCISWRQETLIFWVLPWSYLLEYWLLYICFLLVISESIYMLREVIYWICCCWCIETPLNLLHWSLRDSFTALCCAVSYCCVSERYLVLVSPPLTSGINFSTSSFKSQDEAWRIIISVIFLRICLIWLDWA